MSSHLFIQNLSEWLGVAAVIMLLSLSPRYHRRLVGFRYPRREGVVSLALAALIILFSFLFSRNGSIPLPGSGNIESTRLVATALSLLPFAAALVARRQPLRSAGWERAGMGAALRAALILVFLVVVLRGMVLSFLKDLNSKTAMLLLTWLGIALAEETIFRGYVQLRLMPWLGKWTGTAAAVVLYVLWRLPWLMVSATNLPVELAILAVNGLLSGWLMQKTGNVLAPGIYRAVSEWLRLIP